MSQNKGFIKSFKENWPLLIPAVVGSLLSLRYVLIVHGLPLDDAYIYQKYVVNLIAGRGFCFNPGEVSFGFTSLLWLLILSGGRLLFPSIDYVYLAQGLGLISGFLCLFFAQRVIFIQTESRWRACLIGLYLASSPLFYLNSVSGLETVCFALVAVLFYYFILLRGLERPYLAGFLCGLVFLARPEGLVVFIAMTVIYPLYLLRESVKKGSSSDLRAGKKLVGFLIGYALIVGPYLLYLWFHTSRLLPGTYLGKILSNNPQILLWGLGRRLLAGIWASFLGYFSLVSFNKIGNFLLLLLCAFSLVRLLYFFLLREVSEKSFLARLSTASFLVLPFTYGFKFAIHPFFGGYYHRYLLPVLIFFVLEGAIGLEWLIRAAGKRLVRQAVSVLAVIGLGGLVIYNFALMKGRFPYDDDIYQRVVYRNTDLRYKAAVWIRENTSSQSRVMVGKTGLGIIGSYCDRYVLDEGALINPDIYPYYRAVLKEENKWVKIVEYMTDRKVDYYVTDREVDYYVTIPGAGEYSCLQALAVIKDPDHLPWEFDKIVIYRFKREDSRGQGFKGSRENRPSNP